jgi:hypothetical protein
MQIVMLIFISHKSLLNNTDKRLLFNLQYPYEHKYTTIIEYRSKEAFLQRTKVTYNI